MGVAINCECGCSSEVPALRPWFLKIVTCSIRGSFVMPPSVIGRNSPSEPFTSP